MECDDEGTGFKTVQIHLAKTVWGGDCLLGDNWRGDVHFHLVRSLCQNFFLERSCFEGSFHFLWLHGKGDIFLIIFERLKIMYYIIIV